MRGTDGQGDGGTSWFTFRPDTAEGADAGSELTPVEDRTLRGLHPMVAERLGLWRLRDFDAHAPAVGRPTSTCSARRAATCPRTGG